MSRQTQQGLQPKLRFPEFRDAEEWQSNRLDDVARFVNDRIPLEQLTIDNYVSTENILPDFGGITIASKLPSSGSATRFKKKDILISNIRPYLKKVWFSNKEGGASNDVVVIRSKETILEVLLSSMLRNDVFIGYVMKGAKGVKMPRGDISLMREYPIVYPLNLTEQQKIADCLSSLDELVEAEGQKLETLKTYKKGLMQRLFPVEGETVPKLRFPEFRDSGEWEVERLSNQIQLISGLHLSPNEYGKTGDSPYFTGPSDFTNNSQLITKWTNKSSSTAKDGDILITVKGSGVGELLHLKLPNVAIGRQLMSIRVKYCSNKFLYQLLTTSGELFKKLASGNLIPGLSRGDILTTKFSFPSPAEQQRIADFLYSIDDLITAQSQKIDFLKNHKKGLMQQLFPAINEAQA